MTNKTRIVSARIPNEVADSMEKRLQREGISLREMIVDYANGREVSVNTKNSEKSLPAAKWEEMGSMADFFGISTEDLLDGVYQGLMEGYLTYESGNVLGMPEIDLTEFKEVCGSKDPQKVLDEITRKIRSGMK